MAQSNEWTKILKGVLLVFGLNVAAIAIFLFVSSILSGLVTGTSNALSDSLRSFLASLNALTFMSAVGIGLSQFLYVIPMIIVLARSQRYALMKGVIMGAAMTALLNAGCFIWFNGQFK